MLGVALGGGGVRGFAHVGVLRVLEQAGFTPGAVAGTSMGAIIAALYATLPSLAAVEARLGEFFRHIGPSLQALAQSAAASPGGISLNAPSLMPADVFHRYFDDLIPDTTFEQTRIPLAVVAVDLLSGDELVYRAGPLRRAVLGSAALPGIFPPIPHDGRILIDGGWTNRIPADAARAVGATRVIAVDVSEFGEPPPARTPATGLEIVLRAAEITRNHFARWRSRDADLLLATPTGHIPLHDASHLADCVRWGAETAQAHLTAIRALVSRPDRPTATPIAD